MIRAGERKLKDKMINCLTIIGGVKGIVNSKRFSFKK
jgi:hypothetical protein